MHEPAAAASQLPDALASSHAAWLEAVGRTDVDAYAALVSEDVVWLPPGGETVEGREAFREWLAPFFEAWDYDFSVVDPRFRVVGGWALETGRFVSRMSERAGSGEVEHVGHFVVLWRRDEDGVWRIERYVDDT